MIIGIIGNGFVGRATCLLESSQTKILIYDEVKSLCSPSINSLSDLKISDIVFISVPTPYNRKEGRCHTEIVEQVVHQLRVDIGYEGFIVIRSTVPPGMCDKLGCYFMPEFLTEKNYISDFVNNPNWIFGLLGKNEQDDYVFRELIHKLIETSSKLKYKNIIFTSNKEAEIVKYFRNTYLALKVSFCNEINEYCEQMGVNYENVRSVFVKDPRISESHTSVPGPDGYKGFGGTCFPKDLNSLIKEMENSDVNPLILKAVCYRNSNIDRNERDWEKDINRSVV